MEEVVVADIGAGLSELHALDAPVAEVFALEHAVRALFCTVDVPEHGAFVAKLLPPSSFVSPGRLPLRAALPPQALSADPLDLPTSLARQEHELVRLSEDFWLLLRSSVDPEVSKFLHFSSLSSGCLRCLIVPPPASDPSAVARLLLTTNSPILEPMIRSLRVVDHPPSLEVLRSAVEGPPVGSLPHTALSSIDSHTQEDDRLFAFQKSTVRWMQHVEESSDAIPPSEPLLYAGRSFRMSGTEDVIEGANSGEGVRTGLHPEIEREHKLPCGGLVAHPMGSGKTVIAAELSRRQCNGRSLVLCPHNIQHQWLSVFRDFAPELHAVAPLHENIDKSSESENESAVSDAESTSTWSRSATRLQREGMLDVVQDADAVVLPFEALADWESRDGSDAWTIIRGALSCHSHPMKESCNSEAPFQEPYGFLVVPCGSNGVLEAVHLAPPCASKLKRMRFRSPQPSLQPSSRGRSELNFLSPSLCHPQASNGDAFSSTNHRTWLSRKHSTLSATISSFVPATDGD